MHGRYLVQPPGGPLPAPMLVGFHGYGESAEEMVDRLRSIEGADRWLIVSIQALNRFYHRRTNAVIAGWMTRQDRELAIADNLEYVGAVVDSVAQEWKSVPPVVFAGFSQGVAMAFRAAAALRHDSCAVVAAGGDVPPELDPESLRRIGAVLLCHGRGDEWYTRDKWEADLNRLRHAGVRTEPVEFGGGHEWSADVRHAAADFLEANR